MSLRARIEANHDWLTEFRRDLHRHPELMFEESRTSGKVQDQLTTLGIEFCGGLAKGTGVVAWLPPTMSGGGTVALRADMDALPILEETGAAHASTCPGKMHACGHDGHTAILVGAARALAAEEARANGVLFVFQPAEEGGSGGDFMCQEGALDGSRVGHPADVIYGLHGWPARSQGRFSSRFGPTMAATDQFFITIKGRGGHAAAPDLTTDVVVCLGHLVAALQGIVSRSIAPVASAVLTIANVRAGTGATNIISETAELDGTIRTLDEQTRRLVRERLAEVVQGVCAAFRCQAQIRFEDGYPVTFNDEWATKRWFSIAEKTLGAERVATEPHPKMGAEDFSYYGRHVPACFYFVGLAKDGETDPPGLHTPRFDFNDAVIPDCVEMMCRLALEPVAKP